VRDALVAAIRAHRDEFADAGERAESLRTLPASTVELLRSLGLFWLKTPAELGGTPLAPLDFCDVMEEVGYADTATAWTVMVGNGGTGTAGGWLPDLGARAVFPADGPLPLVVGTPGPRGTGRPVAGGYLLSGRWPFASGCAHADWLIGGFRELSGTEDLSGEVQQYGPGQLPGRLMVAVVPRSSATIVDNWQVAGLQGSGSFDFALSSVFVPAEFTFERSASACRGGALFHQEAHVFLSNEVPPLCVGMALRAVDLMASLAVGTARFPGGPLVSDRAVFASELGRAQTRVRAARAVHREAIASALAAASTAGETSPDVHLAVAAASTYAVEECTSVIFDLFRYGGGRVLALASPLQRYLRDSIAARQHIGVSEENYERAGAHRVRSWQGR
jgi:alkylation response protein AidB-like acyl-CoA dehydrogenase